MIEIRTVAAGRGAAWLLEGFDYFKSNVAAWIGITIILLIITSVSALFPLGGLILQLISPVLLGGLMLGCREADNGGQLKLHHLFAGFSRNTGDLFLLGVFYTVGAAMILALMFIMFIFTIGSMVMLSSMMEGDAGLLLEHMQVLLLIILIGLLLYLPLLMAFWFGPALIVLERQGALNAMKYSFTGCIKNVVPFLIYGVVGLVLSFLATIPFMLGWIVLLPMTVAAFYIGYKDIYSTSADPLITQI